MQAYLQKAYLIKSFLKLLVIDTQQHVFNYFVSVAFL